MFVVASFSCFVGSSNANVVLFIQLWSQHLRWQYSYSLSQLGDPMKIGDTISSRRRTFVWCAGQRRTVFERTLFPMSIESMYLGDCSSLMLVSIKIIPTDVMCIAVWFVCPPQGPVSLPCLTIDYLRATAVDLEYFSLQLYMNLARQWY